MKPPRRTYVVSVYPGEAALVVEAVQREQRARLDDLDDLPARIREWEDDPPAGDPPVRPDRLPG